ncbi:unnamed protein product [Closterium sp. Yama58-4]|nr:unnamed protein product [Closterium sp. Yama58-4]
MPPSSCSGCCCWSDWDGGSEFDGCEDEEDELEVLRDAAEEPAGELEGFAEAAEGAADGAATALAVKEPAAAATMAVRAAMANARTRMRLLGSGAGDDDNHPVRKMDREKLMKMATAVRTGGKGTVRRKKKAAHKTTTTDDKRLSSTLKRLGVNTIPGIEEVNIFKDDTVLHFSNPKVQASIGANTWVVSGVPREKNLQELLPGIINQLGPDNLAGLKKIAQEYQKAGEAAAAAGAAAEDDDEVPELVEGENFEDTSKKEPAAAEA